MPKQYQLFSSRGNQEGVSLSGTMAPIAPLSAMEGLSQQQKGDLFPKEKAYLQKFFRMGRYFNDRGMVSISAARPQNLFLDFLYGLKTKEEALEQTGEKVFTKGKTEDWPKMVASTIPRQAVVDAGENQVMVPAVYGVLPEEVLKEPFRYGQEVAAPIENTTIYQSYLNQQINEYRYQTQFYQEENHLHQAAAVVTGGEKERMMPVKTVAEQAAAQKMTSPTRNNGMAVAMPMIAEKRERPELVNAKNATLETAAMPMLNQWEPLMGPAASALSPSSVALNDWSGLCSFLQQNIAETFTELLQNMIPETEGR